MLKIKCDRCQNELESPGALVFSPPSALAAASVVKYHLCVSCWKALREDIWYKHPKYDDPNMQAIHEAMEPRTQNPDHKSWAGAIWEGLEGDAPKTSVD